jgi:hypothetical protein
VKKKKPWTYMSVRATEDFPATKKRKQFKLPWLVMGKGFDNAGQINQASGKYCK